MSADAISPSHAAPHRPQGRSGLLRWLLRDVFALRPSDDGVLGQLGPLFAVVTAASVLVATFTKTAFLTEYAVDRLPWMFLGSSVFTALLSVAYVAAVGRLQLVPRFRGLVVTSMVTFALLHLAYPLAPRAVALAQLVWCTGLSQLILVQSWNMSSALLPSRQGKRLFPVFAAISTAGAALGGILVRVSLQVVEARHLLWLAVVLLIYPLLQVPRIASALAWNAGGLDEEPIAPSPVLGRDTGPQVTKNPWEEVSRGFRAIGETPLLLRLAMLVFLLQAASLIIDFQFSTELKQRYARNEMAGFLGTYYAIANTVAFFVALMATSRIVRVVGIGVAISASAIFVGVGSGWYFGAGRMGLGDPFWAIVATSFAERIFQFALTRNAMQMLVAPLDSKKGERAKTLIDGVIYRVATAGTSVVLLFVAASSDKLALLAPVTVAACLGVVAIGLSMNPHYRRALFEGLRARRVDSDVDPQTQALLRKSAIGEVRERLASADRRERLAALDIARESRLQLLLDDLLPVARDGDAELARRALELMNDLGLRPAAAQLAPLLTTDPPPAVLREALRLIAHQPDPSMLAVLSPLLQHADLGVARLASGCVQQLTGGQGGQHLQQLQADMASPQADRRARAAFISSGYLPATEVDLARLVHDASPEVRLNAVVSMGQVGALEYVDPLIECLGRGELVSAATAALGRFGPQLVAPIGLRLRQRPPGVAITLRLLRVVERVGGEDAVQLLMDQVQSAVAVVRNNAVQSLWRMARDPDAPRPPKAWLKSHILRDIDTLLQLQRLEAAASGSHPKLQFFVSEVSSLRLQAEMRAFRLLGLLEARAPMHRAYLHYRSPQQRVRSNAVELLDQHITDEDCKPFVALIERVDAGVGGGLGAAEGWGQPQMDTLLQGADPWLVQVWRWLQAPAGGRMSRDPMDMVFLLKAVPLLSDLSGEQLLPVADIVQQVHVESGDLVFAEGQPGNHLYVILEGEVDVLRGREVVAQFGVKDCFGEMALLDQSPRSASVRARTDCELLAISRDDFQDLLDMHPALARGIIRVLTQRLRATNELR
jgi:hypothetical protein